MRFPHPVVPLALTLALALTPARAGAVSVTVQPSDTTVAFGATVTLRLVTDAVADLKGYQLVYTYDAVRLALDGVTPGEVLTAPPGAYAAYLLPDAAAPADSVWYDAARLDGSASGPGVLAYVTFTAIAEGNAWVTCGSVDFRDSGNARTLPDCAGGVVHVLGPVSATPTPWGRLKALYR
jgi:hypothetical protein